MAARISLSESQTTLKKYVKRDLSTVLHEFQKAWRSTQILPAQNGWITTNSAALIKLRKKLQLQTDHGVSISAPLRTKATSDA
jgi:hypothetical protein